LAIKLLKKLSSVISLAAKKIEKTKKIKLKRLALKKSLKTSNPLGVDPSFLKSFPI